MNLLFIVNSKAGYGTGQLKWKKIERKLSVPYEVIETEYQGHATEIVKQYAADSKRPILVVAVGGDGTIHEVIQGSIGYSHIIIGAVAAGSGNDFGRGFERFKNVEEIEQFLQHTIANIPMDIGALDYAGKKQYFMNNAGFGFDAAIAKLANTSKTKNYLNKIRLGKLSYVYYLIKTLFTFERFSLTLIHNGKKQIFQDVWLIVVSNQPYFGGGMRISPKSIPNDGKIELTIVNEVSRLKLLILFMTVFFGKHTKLKSVKQFIATDFNIIIDADVIAHTDGEYAGESTKDNIIHFKVKSEAWRLARKFS